MASEIEQEISKSNVVDDMVASNSILYGPGEHPDHVVVIKYVPYVGDSKRAMDEYSSEIFLGGKQTIVMHNTCEDRCRLLACDDAHACTCKHAVQQCFQSDTSIDLNVVCLYCNCGFGLLLQAHFSLA